MVRPERGQWQVTLWWGGEPGTLQVEVWSVEGRVGRQPSGFFCVLGLVTGADIG